MRTVARALAVIALVSLLFYAQRVIASVPAVIPFHFDASGRPNGFAASSSLLSIPLAAAIFTVVFVGLGIRIPAMARDGVRTLKVPRRELFRALPAEARVRAVEPIAVAFPLLGVFTCVFLGLLLHSLSEVALGHRETLAVGPLALGPLALVTTLILMNVATGRAVEREASARSR
jgi:uncharacterized membrane protein